MAVTGYDKQMVNDSLVQVRVTYGNVCKNVGGEAQNFIQNLADLWASATAQDWFRETYKPSVDNLFLGAGGVNECFNSILNVISNAGNTWSAELNHGIDSFTGAFSDQYVPMNISPIKQVLPDGTVGADIQACQSTSESGFANITSAIDSVCVQLKESLARSGFKDEANKQQVNLDNAIDAVNQSFKATFKKIQESLMQTIREEANRHEDVAANVAGTFNAN